jgi:hypothetical protein
VTEPTEPLLLTRAEAAARLGVTSNWLKEKAAARAVPFTRLGAKNFKWTEEQIRQIAAMFAETPQSMPTPLRRPA